MNSVAAEDGHVYERKVHGSSSEMARTIVSLATNGEQLIMTREVEFSSSGRVIHMQVSCLPRPKNISVRGQIFYSKLIYFK